MVNHIFPAHMPHLSVQLIRTFYTQFQSIPQRFIVYGESSDFGPYGVLNGLNSIEMVFVDNVSSFKSLLNKSDSILLHSLTPSCCIYFSSHFYKNVTVVCWGSGIKLKTIKNYLLYPLKFYLYHSFKGMITLMEPDMHYLKKTYFVKDVVNQPYIGERELALDEYVKKDARIRISETPVVYVGNNSSCINSFITLASEYLSTICQTVDLQFMFHYDVRYDDPLFVTLNSICKKTYIKYTFNTQTLSLNDYIGYIDCCDIYICGEDRQTGLAAIYTALRLGKKLYLNGNNYEWVKKIGCYAHHISELLNETRDSFLEPDSNEIRDNNISKITDFESFNKKKDSWSRILLKV